MVIRNAHLYPMRHCPGSMLVFGAHVFCCLRLLARCWRVRREERVPFAPLALQLVGVACRVGRAECTGSQICVLLVDARLLDCVSAGGGMHVLGLEAGHDSRCLLGLVTRYGRLQLRWFLNSQLVWIFVWDLSLNAGANTTTMEPHHSTIDQSAINPCVSIKHSMQLQSHTCW